MCVHKRITVRAFFDTIRDWNDTVYEIRITNRFEKSLNLSYRRNLDLGLLREVIHMLAAGKKLPEKYRPHTLTGYASMVWECHIKPDWLVVWQQNDEQLILVMLDTGTHSDLF